MHRLRIGKSIYRKVEGAQPGDVPEAFSGDEGEKKEPTEEEANVAAIAEKMDGLKAEMVDELNKAGVKASPPRYITTRGGFRLMSEFEAVGALEGTTGMVTFDFAVGWVYDLRDENALADKLGISQYWQRVVSLDGWKDVGLSQVAVDWCGESYVAGEVQGSRPPDYTVDPTKLMKGLLGSFATLQNVNARTEDLNLQPLDEQDDEVFKDWALEQALQMIQHAVSAEKYSMIDVVKRTIHELFKAKELDSFQVNYVITLLNSLKEEAEGINVVSLSRLADKMKQDKEIDESAVQKVLQATDELIMEPEQFFDRNTFFKMYTELLDDTQLASKMKKALSTFESDEEWAEALRGRVEGKHAPAPLEAQVQLAIKQLTPEAQYEGGQQIAVADDGSIIAQIKAPYPFYYRFEHAAGELKLLEAAMQICNRTPFVSEEDGNLGLQEELLKADVYLAAAHGNAAGQDTPKGTRPQDAEGIARDLVNFIGKQQQEAAPTDKKEAPATEPPTAPA
jgi:hypothetical protein